MLHSFIGISAILSSQKIYEDLPEIDINLRYVGLEQLGFCTSQSETEMNNNASIMSPPKSGVQNIEDN